MEQWRKSGRTSGNGSGTTVIASRAHNRRVRHECNAVRFMRRAIKKKHELAVAARRATLQRARDRAAGRAPISHSKKGDRWLVYHTLLQPGGRRPQLVVTAVARPLHLALLGGSEIAPSSDLGVALLDQWIVCRADGRDWVSSIAELRRAIDAALEVRAARPRDSRDDATRVVADGVSALIAADDA